MVRPNDDRLGSSRIRSEAFSTEKTRELVSGLFRSLADIGKHYFSQFGSELRGYCFSEDLEVVAQRFDLLTKSFSTVPTETVEQQLAANSYSDAAMEYGEGRFTEPRKAVR